VVTRSQAQIIISVALFFVNNLERVPGTYKKTKTKITGEPCYMQEIGTPKICLHIINSHIKRPTITVN
jgi:hypothetical protein